MPECVGNYSIPTTDGIVEGADMLEGAGILNFLNIYVQQTPLNSPNYSVDNSRFCVEFPQLYINYSCPNCQFAGLTLLADAIVTMYYCVLKEVNFKIALTMHLPSWRIGLEQINTKPNRMCHKQ